MLQSLFNKVAGLGSATLLKRDSNTGVFLWNLWNFQEQLFLKTSMNNCFWNYKTIVPGTARPITISSGKFMFHNKCFSDHLLGVGGGGGGGVIEIPTLWLLRNFRWSTFVLAKLGHPSSTFIYWSWDSWFLQKIFKDAGGLTCSLKVMMDLWQKTTALRFWAVRVKQETLWKCQHQLAKKNSPFQKNLLVAAS